MTGNIAAVYIITNKTHKVLYTGVTMDILKRMWEHHSKAYPQGFTARYNCTELVWYELHDSVTAAIAREKQLKGGSRAAKIALIEQYNPKWQNLYDADSHLLLNLSA